MTQKDIEKLSEPFRENRVIHLFLARTRNGISLSSIADGDDLYEFFQVMADQNPVILDIMQSVIDSRKKKVKNITIVN